MPTSLARSLLCSAPVLLQSSCNGSDYETGVSTRRAVIKAQTESRKNSETSAGMSDLRQGGCNVGTIEKRDWLLSGLVVKTEMADLSASSIN